MKNFYLILVLFFISVFLTGCGLGTSNLCVGPKAEDSIVCKLADRLHTTPEVMSQSLIVANFGALEADLYTASQAEKFLDEIQADLEKLKETGKEVTYTEIIKYMNSKYNLLPKKVQAVFVLIDPAGLTGQSIKIPLSAYDIDLLLTHIEKQKQLIVIYL